MAGASIATDFDKTLGPELHEMAQTTAWEMADWVRRVANEQLERFSPPPEASMDEWHTEPITESARIYERGGRVHVEWEHPHTDKFEFGVRPHHIEGDPLLVFPDWETGETIFTTEVDHPGIPAMGFIRFGEQRVMQAFERGEFGP